MLLFVFLSFLLTPSILIAQNEEPQEIELTEQGQEELNQALVTAVTNGRVNEARELLAQGADINVVDEYGRTPLYIAAAESD